MDTHVVSPSGSLSSIHEEKAKLGKLSLLYINFKNSVSENSLYLSQLPHHNFLMLQRNVQIRPISTSVMDIRVRQNLSVDFMECSLRNEVRECYIGSVGF